jgi:hypothetical protein
MAGRLKVRVQLISTCLGLNLPLKPAVAFRHLALCEGLIIGVSLAVSYWSSLPLLQIGRALLETTVRSSNNSFKPKPLRGSA